MLYENNGSGRQDDVACALENTIARLDCLRRSSGWMLEDEVAILFANLGGESYRNGIGPVMPFSRSKSLMGGAYGLAIESAREDEHYRFVKHTEESVRADALRRMGLTEKAVFEVLDSMEIFKYAEESEL